MSAGNYLGITLLIIPSNNLIQGWGGGGGGRIGYMIVYLKWCIPNALWFKSSQRNDDRSIAKGQEHD